jgi:hypothetical protein
MKNITLKKLKVQEILSEETLCFSADLYENGKLVAHVSNRGYGGSNNVLPAKGLTYKDIAHLTDIDTECDILTIAEEMNIIKKEQGKNFVLKKENKLYCSQTANKKSFAQLKKAKDYSSWILRQVSMYKEKGYEVLNTNL